MIGLLKREAFTTKEFYQLLTQMAGQIQPISMLSRLSKYWSDSRENLPAAKYLDLSAWFFRWLEKNSDLTAKQKAEEL